ncbi:hypothetical protein [Candidatus Phytoplasma prunorum]|uniref:hypothetical protein n=1 Tax=Candidatus Phytoplasma prunorum TaxID=47565 RepID=UPI002FF12D4A
MTYYYFFNDQEFHRKNLNNVFNLYTRTDQKEQEKTTKDQDINSRMYQPFQACQLLKEVNRDFISKFPENQEPLIIKIFTDFDEITEFREVKLNSFLINSWSKCFKELLFKPQFYQITERSSNVELGQGFL